MTEQEAEVARLARIWVPPDLSCDQITWYGENGAFCFSANIAEDVSFDCSQGRAPTLNSMCGRRFGLALQGQSDHASIGHLWCYGKSGEVRSMALHDESSVVERVKQFAQEWMPIFRRGCWLSGCPIEASAHEKAEWIQSFSREEIQAWNLTM